MYVCIYLFIRLFIDLSIYVPIFQFVIIIMEIMSFPLFFSQQYNPKSCRQLLMKFFGGGMYVSLATRLYFDVDPDRDANIGIFNGIFNTV